MTATSARSTPAGIRSSMIHRAAFAQWSARSSTNASAETTRTVLVAEDAIRIVI